MDVWLFYISLWVKVAHNVCRHGTNAIDSLGFAALTVWNMRTWKPMVCVCLLLIYACLIAEPSYPSSELHWRQFFLLVKIHQQSHLCLSIITGSFWLLVQLMEWSICSVSFYEVEEIPQTKTYWRWLCFALLYSWYSCTLTSNRYVCWVANYWVACSWFCN